MGDSDPHVLGRDLTESPLASVLITALKQKVTGELEVKHSEGEDLVYFQAGIVLGTQVKRAFKPLGRMLLELGWISLSALEKSLEMMAQGHKQGEALVEIGAIDQDQLEEGLRLSQIRNIVEMARLTEGQLEFTADKPPEPWVCGVPPNALRTLRVVLTVEQSVPVSDSIIERLGGENIQVRIPVHLKNVLEHFDLDDDEVAAAEMLIEPKTLTAFWEVSKLAPPRAKALVAELAVTGVLVSYGTAEDTGNIGNSAGSAERRSAEEARARLTEIMHAAPQAPMAKRNRSLEDDRARRRKLLQRAVASNVASDRLSKAFTSQRKETGVTAAAPQPSPLSPPPEDGRALSAEERTLEALILERMDLLPTQDFFARLNLPKSATSAAVKAAFVKAVQLYHPDHLPPKLAHLAAKQREIFAAVKEAYDTLSDDERRREYLTSKDGQKRSTTGQTNAAGSASAPRAEDSKIAAFRGDALLQKCDYVAAADAFHAAYQLSQDGDHLASEIWCTLVDPARKGEHPDAKQKLLDAVAKHPEAARASYYLGLLARMDNRTDEAEQLFRNVLKINPKHLEAGQEIRLIELRKKRQAAAAAPKK
jgi:curved DNA-binding protein CbpA